MPLEIAVEVLATFEDIDDFEPVVVIAEKDHISSKNEASHVW
jgi:hypothetical protein